MKKHAPTSKPARTRASEDADPRCDGSPPYPPTPPPTDDIPGEEKQEFVYFGTRDLAKGFNDGQLVQHTMALENGEQAFVFSLRGGPHKRRTLSKLEVRVLLGPCTIVIQHGATRTLQTGATMDIPAGSTFSLATTEKAVLLARSLTGPGLAKPTGGGSGGDAGGNP